MFLGIEKGVREKKYKYYSDNPCMKKNVFSCYYRYIQIHNKIKSTEIAQYLS